MDSMEDSLLRDPSLNVTRQFGPGEKGADGSRPTLGTPTRMRSYHYMLLGSARTAQGSHLDFVVIDEDATAHGSFPLAMVFGCGKHRKHLCPLAQGHPFGMRLVRPDDIAQVALLQEVVDRLGAETDGPASSSALSESRWTDLSLLP